MVVTCYGVMSQKCYLCAWWFDIFVLFLEKGWIMVGHFKKNIHQPRR